MKNYKLFFDNQFTSVGLVCELQKVGIQSLGTVRPNRISNISLPSEEQMKKKEAVVLKSAQPWYVDRE